MLAVPPSVITPEHETVTITECFACLPLLSPSVLRARIIVKTKSKSQSQVRSEAPTGHSRVSFFQLSYLTSKDRWREPKILHWNT